MVDIQTAYYMVAATGVLIAAAYYIANIRATQRNLKLTLETRKLQLLTSFSQRLFDYEGSKRYVELMNMNWRDWDDYEKKYGSDFNLDNAANRTSTFLAYDLLGSLLREKVVDAETLYNLNSHFAIFLWFKFDGLIDYLRKEYFGDDFLQDFEFLAQEMLKIKLKRDPTFKVPENFISYGTK